MAPTNPRRFRHLTPTTTMPKQLRISANQFRQYKTYDEIKPDPSQEPYMAPQKTRRKLRDNEHQLQSNCYAWFIERYLPLYRLLFAIPNGGQRNVRVAQKLKREGAVRGVADLFLSVARQGYHGLYIEMKTLERSSKQSKEQKDFQKKVTEQGYLYKVIRSKEEFEDLIITYLDS